HLREQLASMGIDARLTADSSRHTTLKTRYVAEGQQIMRADRESPSALAAPVEQELLTEFLEALGDSQVVILSDYAKGVLSETVTRAAIDRARAAGKVVIVDPKSRDFEKYRGASVITPNQSELQLAAGHDCDTQDEIVKGARAVLQRGVCECLVVTRGKE